MTPTAEAFIQRKKKEFESEKRREVRAKDISRKGWRIWKREACTFMPQSDYPEKVFVIERLRYIGDEGSPPPWPTNFDRCQYRIGYFIVAKIGKRQGNWWWGQYCPFIPSRDFHDLMGKAEREGTILK